MSGRVLRSRMIRPGIAPSLTESQAAHGRQCIENLVVGQPVAHMLAIASRLRHPSGLELLQVLGGIGDAQPGQARELLDAALALGEIVQQFQPRRAAERAGDDGKLLKQRLFGVRHRGMFPFN